MNLQNNDKILILLSGGADSTTLLIDVLSALPPKNIEAISFYYDTKRKKCVQFAKKTCKKFKISHKIFDYRILSKLTNGNIVSGRNMFFLVAATLYAKQNGFNKILIGLAKDDFSCYNDCKKEFVDMLNKLLPFATEFNVEIIAPYIDKDKVEIWQIADNLGYLDYVYKNSYSCWKNKGKPCNKCYSCKQREDSYAKYITK